MSELTVVKLGGSLLDDSELRSSALRVIAERWQSDSRMVVVHGGGRNIDQALSRMGIPKRTVEGLRVTDAATLDVVIGVLAGLVNKTLVAELGAAGVAACGISGADGDTLWAQRHPLVDGHDLENVGLISESDPTLVLNLVGHGYLPVVASLACGPAGTLLNVNADAAASALAVALGATKLIFLTDVEGVVGSEGRVVPNLDSPAAIRLLSTPAIKGGMKPKLLACIEALAGGVDEVVIAGPTRHASSLIGGQGGTHVVAA